MSNNELNFNDTTPEYMEKLSKQIETAKADLHKMNETHSKPMDSESKDQVELTEKSESLQEVSTSEDKSQSEREYTEVEKEQLAEGWDPTKSKSAEEFKKDGSFFKKIAAQNKKIDDLTNAVKASLELNAKIEAVKYKEGYENALRERQKAVEEGDTLAFKIAEEKLIQQQQLKPVEAPRFTQDQQELFDNFKTRNKDWFAKSDNESREMTELAVAYDQYNLGKGKSYEESMKDVEHIIKLKFPHRFSNPKQDKPTAVIKSEPKSIKSDPTSKMTDQQRNFAKQAQRIDPNFKLERYVKQLKETGALRDE